MYGRSKKALLLLACLLASVSAIATGKFYYRTEEGQSPKVSFPFGKARFYVRNVIDGDTVELGDGEKVRYIGIDAPEERRRVGETWVYDPEPFAVQATQENRRLVQGKRVRLEFDAERQDRFGRVLAYVYVPAGRIEAAYDDQGVLLDNHEIFVNAYLIRMGLARPLRIPPNTRYAGLFERLASRAQRLGLGLWEKRE